MKTTTLIVGILLLLVGLATLAYEGYLTFSTNASTTIEQGAQVTRTTVPLRPITGVLAAICGFVLILVSNKKPTSQ